MNNARTFSRLAICLAAALAPRLAAAQPGDEFASEEGRGMPFANVPEYAPPPVQPPLQGVIDPFAIGATPPAAR